MSFSVQCIEESAHSLAGSSSPELGLACLPSGLPSVQHHRNLVPAMRAKYSSLLQTVLLLRSCLRSRDGFPLDTKSQSRRAAVGRAQSSLERATTPINHKKLFPTALSLGKIQADKSAFVAANQAGRYSRWQPPQFHAMLVL